MTDDLSTKLAVLTEDRPEPADPAAPVRLRIKRRQRRRRATVAVVGTAAATAAVLAAGPFLGSLRSSEPGVAGFAAPPTAAPSYVMPEPWSDEVFTKKPDAGAYKPKAYYIAKGTIPTESWAVLAFSEHGCMVTDEGPANSFGRPYVCFSDWRPGQRAAFQVVTAHTKEKSTTKVDATLIFGAVSEDARNVVIKAAGQTYQADAVGTPASGKLRFFALVIRQKDAKVAEVTPLDAAGKLADAPTGVPTGIPCEGTCTTATASTPK
jgi:hypothetical protein